MNTKKSNLVLNIESTGEGIAEKIDMLLVVSKLLDEVSVIEEKTGVVVGAKINFELSVVEVTVDDNVLLVEVFDISNKEVAPGFKVELNVDSRL